MKGGEGKDSFVPLGERAKDTQLDTIKSARGPGGQRQDRGTGKN